MQLLIPLLILLIFILIYYIFKYYFHSWDSFSIENNVLQDSIINDKSYHVHTKHNDLQLAADTFAHIDIKVTEFLNYLNDKYKNSENAKKKEVAMLMLNRYVYKNLRESSPLNSDNDTSYTINKGDVIAICIRSGLDYGIHDFDTIMFVVLHELTHLAIKAYDHPDEFWQVFKFVLEEIEYSGMYKSINYSLYPVEYCGITVNYNPRYDPAIKSI